MMSERNFIVNSGPTPVSSIVLILIVGLQGCLPFFAGSAVATGAAAMHDRRTAGKLLDDQTIEIKARKAISAEDTLSGESHVNVVSFNGILLLVGQIASEEDRDRVVAAVWNISGIREVVDQLEIGTPTRLLDRSNDTLITSQVKTKLLTAKDTSGSHIKVVTENKVVYLMGLVTPAEAERATDVARRSRGVEKVVKVFEYLEDSP